MYKNLSFFQVCSDTEKTVQKSEFKISKKNCDVTAVPSEYSFVVFTESGKWLN
jgi:hypothetical protein